VKRPSVPTLPLLCAVAALAAAAAPASTSPVHEKAHGAVIRGPLAQKRLAVVFTGHEHAEGADTILSELRRHRAKASFFLTGDFLKNPVFTNTVAAMLLDGHYIGGHSDKHLLYCSWDADRKTLVSRAQFRADLEQNLEKLRAVGVAPVQAHFFLPAYEHCNEEIAAWTAERGLTLVNLTPGTRSAADYTGEKDENFVPSQRILDSVLGRETQDPHGLNGFILLFHVGAGPGRSDKFHTRFGDLLDKLSARGYKFVRIDELLTQTTK
jgi:peptidoglycan/xylan/chitin deacetylase (PgdA/CDA1 family)